MNAALWPVVFYQGLTALVHALVFVTGFVLLKRSTNWFAVLGIALGVALLTIVLTFASYFLQGTERALQMILPGNDMFMVAGLPTIVSAIFNSFLIMCAAYAVFVMPHQKAEKKAL